MSAPIHVSSLVMDFLIYSRGAPAAAVADDDPALNERHWTYMDRFADAMTARGPTLGRDRESWTGSLHVVDLPDPETVRTFVAREPYNQAGLFAEHRIWRFADVLGRTMWQFAAVADEPRFLVLARRASDGPHDLSPVPVADLPLELGGRLILYRGLRNLEDDKPIGVAMAAQAATREVLDALLRDARAGLAPYDIVDIHDWRFGGRR